MSRKSAADVVIKELGFLLESVPDLTVEELGAALREAASASGARGPGGDAPGNESILACAKAFGNHRQFGSKQVALDLLREELGLILSEGTAWKHLVGAVAIGLLERPDGAAKAEEILRKHGLKAPKAKTARRRPDTARSRTLEMVHGIVNAKDT